jgi:hypothetical protein
MARLLKPGWEWDNVVSTMPRYDFFHLSSYHQAVCAMSGNWEPILIVAEKGDFRLALPIIRKAIPTWLDSKACFDSLYDATSVYGYVGPLFSHSEVPTSIGQDLMVDVTSTLAELKIVTFFARMNPFIPIPGFIRSFGEIVKVGDIVTIDLSLSSEEQISQYRQDHRAGLRKIRALGIDCFHDEKGSHYEEFQEIYRETMDRVGAREGYLFSKAFFDTLQPCLGKSLHLFVCTYDRRVISASLVTMCLGIIHAFLSGSREEYHSLGSKKLLTDSIRSWGVGAKQKVFNLGGGVGSVEDSLYKFKAGFSKTRAAFEVWRWVVNRPQYEALVEMASANTIMRQSEGASIQYFPPYRRGEPDL